METVVITGANRGIGLQMARRFVERGARVIGTCRDPANAGELHSVCAASGAVVSLEVTSAHSVASLIEYLNGSSVDVLINNAGVMGGKQSIDEMDYDAWLDAFQINTIAPFRLATALRPNLIQSPRPRVVTITSQMGALSRNSVGQYAYRTSKAAANKAMQVMAQELRAQEIVVCPVHPGWVRTDMGGPQADLSVEESANGLVDLISGLSMEHSGRFWTWDGREHAW